MCRADEEVGAARFGVCVPKPLRGKFYINKKRLADTIGAEDKIYDSLRKEVNTMEGATRKCDAPGCEDGLKRLPEEATEPILWLVDTADDPEKIMQEAGTTCQDGLYEDSHHLYVECRACEGRGWVPTQDLEEILAALVGLGVIDADRAKVDPQFRPLFDNVTNR